MVTTERDDQELGEHERPRREDGAGPTGRLSRQSSAAAVEAPGVDAEEQRAAGGDQARQDRDHAATAGRRRRDQPGTDREHAPCRGASGPSARPRPGRSAAGPRGRVARHRPRRVRASVSTRSSSCGSRRAAAWPATAPSTRRRPRRTASSTHDRADQPADVEARRWPRDQQPHGRDLVEHVGQWCAGDLDASTRRAARPRQDTGRSRDAVRAAPDRLHGPGDRPGRRRSPTTSQSRITTWAARQPVGGTTRTPWSRAAPRPGSARRC